jgi:Anti-sigma-D factor RsdA to sigma factor binding region
MPDFGRWTSNGGDPSLNEINRADRFLDALANDQPVYSTDPGEAELAFLLSDWRDGVRDAPLTAVVTPRDAAIALRDGLAASSRKRSRTSLALVGSVAAGLLCLGGFSAAVYGSGPGDAFYGIRSMFFGQNQQARDDQVVLAAQTELAQVQQLIQQGNWQQAQDRLVTLSTTVQSVDQVERKQELIEQYNALTYKVVEQDPAATLPPPGEPPPVLPSSPLTLLQVPVIEDTTVSTSTTSSSSTSSSSTSTSTSPSAIPPSDLTSATTTTATTSPSSEPPTTVTSTSTSPPPTSQTPTSAPTSASPPPSTATSASPPPSTATSTVTTTSTTISQDVAVPPIAVPPSSVALAPPAVVAPPSSVAPAPAIVAPPPVVAPAPAPAIVAPPPPVVAPAPAIVAPPSAASPPPVSVAPVAPQKPREPEQVVTSTVSAPSGRGGQ